MHSVHAAFLSRRSVILASPVSRGYPCPLGFIITASSSKQLFRESHPAIHRLPRHVFEITEQDSMALLAYALHVILRLFELFSTKKLDGTVHHVEDSWWQDFRQLVILHSHSGNKEMNTGAQLTSPFYSDHQMVPPTVSVSLSTSINLLGNPSQADPKAYLLSDSRACQVDTQL